MDSYVTLTEAAELENTSYDNMQRKVHRNYNSFRAKKEKRLDRGKDMTMIPVSSLSKEARQKYKAREKVRLLTEIPETEQDLDGVQDVPEYPWYLGCDIESYIAENKVSYYKAVELSNIVKECISHQGQPGHTEFMEELARERLGKKGRTLYRYVKQYLEAEAWAEQIGKQDGKNHDYFKILCLCKKPKAKGNFPSVAPEVKQCIKNIWFNKDFARNHGTREMVCDKLQEVAAVNQWEKLPSYQTVARYIDYLMNDEKMAQAWFLQAYGIKDFKNKMMRKGSRDIQALDVMEVVMGDEHTFDCWVSYRFPNGKVAAIRPKLVAWIDVRSRMIMGDIVCKDANREILKSSLLKMMFQEHGGLPKIIYIDNGKDYTAREMTGTDRNDRTGQAKEYLPEFDDVEKGFYHSIGIEDYHRALPYEPWSKSQIERYFRTVCNKFTKWFNSYTGTLTGSMTSEKIDRNIPKMLERGELFTMEQFYEEWTKWLSNNLSKKHAGLKKEQWKTPLEMFENCPDRYYKPLPPKSQCTMFMMKAEHKHVYNIGIKFQGREYRSEKLDLYIGENVDIRYDPHDMATIYVFQNGKQICEAYEQELLMIAPRVEQAALQEHKRMQNRQIREARRILEENNMPFEELNDQYIGFSSSVGGIELMKAPAKKDNVTAFPMDRTYQNGFRGKKNTENEELQEDNVWLQEQADEALKMIRAMNE